jgi:hypothetical protein
MTSSARACAAVRSFSSLPAAEKYSGARVPQRKRNLLSNYAPPTLTTGDFLVLLEKMVEGQSGSHIDGAMKDAEEQDARLCF